MWAWLTGPDPAVKRSLYLESHWHAGADDASNCCRVRRFGNAGDGGKQVCVSDLDAAPPDVLVSIGSNGDFSFETAMLAAYPTLDVHVYDGTYSPKLVPNGVTYHESNAAEGMRLPHFQRKARAILKMDCEGCEFAVLPWLMAHHAFQQILVEVHYRENQEDVHKLMTRLNATHAVFSNEPNLEAPGYTEYGLRQR